MKSAYYERYGAPDVLSVRDLPAPQPGPQEVLIRQMASNVSPADCAMRSADPFIIRFFSGLLRPRARVPGETIAGMVEAVGSGVRRFRPGTRVFGVTAQSVGALAEWVAIPEDSAIVTMPDGLSYDEAGGLPYSFLTAMPFLRDEARLQPGQSILINGAAGSVGTLAVQLAHNMGAIVEATCSTANVEMVHGLGADRVIDRTVEDFTTARAAYDVIFDAVGKSSFSACRATLKPGGIYLTTVPSVAILLAMLSRPGRDGKRGKLATTGLRSTADKTRDLEALSAMVDAGKLRAIIGRTYPLSEIAEAHRYVETGHKTGDVIIRLS
jgi:NADPH:quinone reductase-like Zn-dependent oxidoreductase